VNNKPTKVFAALAVTAALALGACAGGDSPTTPTAVPAMVTTEVPAAGEAVVQVAQFKFAPEQLEVTAGTTVRWDNSDEILHTATSGTPDATTADFDGQMSGAGTSFSFTFETPGTYAYFCSRHVFMTGEVVVT
jgi:plastocyanin